MILVIAGATGPASAGDRVDDGKLVHDVIWRVPLVLEHVQLGNVNFSSSLG